ncbi:MAG: hypothetical protein PVF45_12355 [Anaerolineae bacterium]|jgi:hypothetical protein
MHWTERQSAVARVGAELRKRGWTVHGYTEDRSNMMVDYYAPASWDGVATHPDHPGVVVCVDVSGYTQEHYQGQDDGRPSVHHATPKGKTWHVERDGHVVKTGVGLRGCAAWNKETAQGALWQLVSQIETAALLLPVTGDEAQHFASGEGYTVEYDRDWTWLHFDAKPPEPIREALKRTFGARWSRKRRAWYIRRRVEADAVAQAIQGAV